jgi:hypothetical protein
MAKQRQFTFVVAVNTTDVFETNFLSSECLRGPHPHEIIVQKGFGSASKGHNDALDRSRNDLVIFVHQDVILPALWIDQLEKSLDDLEAADPQWGVLGCYGVSRDGQGFGYVYSSGLGIIGQPFEHPVEIQSLDEIVLILRKSSGLRFDDNLPHFHLYGTDICRRAEQLRRKSYAISCFCIHNTNQDFILPQEFYTCCDIIRRSWKSHLPIQAPCVRITRLKVPIYIRKLKEIYFSRVCGKKFGDIRAQDVPQLLIQVEAMRQARSE